MSISKPILYLVRRDLRLADNPALMAAVSFGRPIIPVFIYDEVMRQIGAAAKWRFGLGLAKFAQTLERAGSRLIVRRGTALDVVRELVAQTGADQVVWARCYDPTSIARDTALKAGLKADGIEAQSFKGHLLFEPWDVQNLSGGYYKVYTPFWKSVRGRDVGSILDEPDKMVAPDNWPDSLTLDELGLGREMVRGADIVGRYVCVGAAAAQDRLAGFLQDRVARYQGDRDFPALEATSRLSENLTYGEISPRQVWYGGRRALQEGAQGAEHFLKELVWREFAYHLMGHNAQMETVEWRAEWQGFGWHVDSRDAEAWRRGQTGEPMVDAAMRELYVTGTMHNRMRMIVGSYLTKHLLTNWRVGMAWFADTLIDWDPAANAMGWQWIAGCGPDAAPYFRVFNPAGQGDKFDKNADYRARYLGSGLDEMGRSGRADFHACVPKSWGELADSIDVPIVTLAQGRARALEAYATFKGAGD